MSNFRRPKPHTHNNASRVTLIGTLTDERHSTGTEPWCFLGRGAAYLPHPSIALSAWKITKYHYCVSAAFRVREMRYMPSASSNDSRQTELNNLGERS
jgi:hypothetical protein